MAVSRVKVTRIRTAGARMAVLAAVAFLSCAPVRAEKAIDAEKPQAPSAASGELTMEVFLDRLMRAESGGKTFAKNPRSTALGPYQFIASTWLQVVRKNFAQETEPLRVDQILDLRTDRLFARRAAEVYTQENAAYLVSQGHKATFPNLRLAFLVGPGAAARVLAAKPETGASELLGATVIGANPFMANLTAAGLIARCARDITTSPTTTAGVTPEPAMVLKARADGSLEVSEAPKTKSARPRISVACDLSRPSCRRWLALAERRVRKQRRASN